MYLNGYGQRSLPANLNSKEAEMANFVPKPNTGRVWPNKYRKENEKAPHYKGNAMIEGVGMRDMAMWVNYVEGTKDVKDVAVKFSDYKPKDTNGNGTNDEVPF